ncbi:MAG: DUF3822 family protein [Bacteroidaceae bacterium]|nr:DUF3822 family protein [Bacteroidaceae bacterium]
MQVTGSNSHQYILSIRLSADGFYFALLNQKVKENDDSSTYNYKVDESLSFTANLKQAIEELEWLSYKYKAVNIELATQRFTLVPLDFFEEEHAETLFYQNFQKVDNEVVEYNVLQKNNAVVVYGIDKVLLALIYHTFPEAHLKVQAAALIDRLSLLNRKTEQKQMLCVVGKDCMTIVVMEGHHLLYGNSFHCTHTTDRMYYALYVWKLLGLDQTADEMLLACNTTDSEEIKMELEKYISNIKPVDNCFDLETAEL